MTSRMPMTSFGDVIHGYYITFFVPAISKLQQHYVFAYTVRV